MKQTKFIILIILFVFALATGCKKDGCTDPLATNYDANAKKDDGSCLYDQDSIPEEEENFASCELCHTSYAHLQEIYSPDTASGGSSG